MTDIRSRRAKKKKEADRVEREARETALRHAMATGEQLDQAEAPPLHVQPKALERPHVVTVVERVRLDGPPQSGRDLRGPREELSPAAAAEAAYWKARVNAGSNAVALDLAEQSVIAAAENQEKPAEEFIGRLEGAARVARVDVAHDQKTAVDAHLRQTGMPTPETDRPATSDPRDARRGRRGPVSGAPRALNTPRNHRLKGVRGITGDDLDEGDRLDQM